MWQSFRLSAVLLGLFFLSNSLWAQKGKLTEDKIAQNMAKTICDCMNKDFKGMDKNAYKDLVSMLRDPANADAYVAKMPPKRQEKLEAELFRVGQASEHMDACLSASDLEGQFMRANLVLQDMNAFMNQVVKHMNKVKKCELPYLIMNMGLQMQSAD